VRPFHEITEVVRALRRLAAPWAVAGGWAIDLALGRVTRPHGDVDVALLRDDQDALRSALRTWAFSVVVDGVSRPWPSGARVDAPTHEVHARSRGGRAIEFLLNERDGADWRYRRDFAVRRPLARAFRDVAGGVRALAPEIVLLYKSKAPRAADDHDFRVALPLLDDEARRWLTAALRRADARHPWASALAVDAQEWLTEPSSGSPGRGPLATSPGPAA